MAEPTVLCESAASKPMPWWMSVLAILFGIIFLHAAYKDIVSGKFEAELAYNLFIGFVCVCGARINRKVYLSDIGIIRELDCWGRVTRRIVQWDDIRHVTLAFRRGRLMAFFEIDTTGLKILFSAAQGSDVRDILDEYIPDVEVTDLSDYGRT